MCAHRERESEEKGGGEMKAGGSLKIIYELTFFSSSFSFSIHIYLALLSLSTSSSCCQLKRANMKHWQECNFKDDERKKKKTREKKAAFPFIYHSFSAFTFHVSSFRRALSHCSSSRSTEEHWCGGRIMTLANSSRKEDCKRVERDEKLMASLKFGTW